MAKRSPGAKLFGRSAYARLTWLALGGLAWGVLEIVSLTASSLSRAHLAAVTLPDITALLTLPGGVAALLTFFLMLGYLARYDPSPPRDRRIWLLLFVLGGTFTAAIYCVTAYRRQCRDAGFAALDRRPWRAPGRTSHLSA